MLPPRTGQVLLFVLFLMMGLSCMPKPQPKKTTASEEGLFKATKKVIPVTEFLVASREIPLIIKEAGRTEAADRFEAKAPSKVKILDLLVEEGQRVNAGDPLIKFDDEETRLRLNRARAEIQEAEAALAYTGALRPQPQQLQQRVIEEGEEEEIPPEIGETEGSEEKLTYHQATLERARADFELYDHMSETSQINSPISGVVTNRFVTEGVDVLEDQPLLEVVRLDPIRFVFSVPADELTYLEKSGGISVRISSLPGQEFTGEIFSVGAEANDDKNAVEVTLNIPNPDLAIKAEMRGDVEVQTTGRRKIISIQDSAVVHSDKTDYVFRIDANRVRRIAVELGDSINGQPTVEEGLEEGDRIVATSEEDLIDGATVEVQ